MRLTNAPPIARDRVAFVARLATSVPPAGALSTHNSPRRAMIRVFLVASDECALDGMASVLATSDNFLLIGSMTEARLNADDAAQRAPDLILLDPMLPLRIISKLTAAIRSQRLRMPAFALLDAKARPAKGLSGSNIPVETVVQPKDWEPCQQVLLARVAAAECDARELKPGIY